VAATQLSESLAGAKYFGERRPGREHEASQFAVINVSGRDPQNLRRWSESLDQPDKVIILRDEDESCGVRCILTRAIKDLVIARVQKSEILNVHGVEAEFLPEPYRESRRKLSINPNSQRYACGVVVHESELCG
jgi:hypothetical protein